MPEPLYQLALYNNWANKLLLAEFKRLGDAVPSSCLHLMSHIVNAQVIWVSRMNGEQPALGVWQDHDLAACERYHESSSAALQQKIASWKNGEMTQVNYTNTQHKSFENSLLDLLLHTFNHGTYHRAQIAQEMRKNGLQPINTDYIAFVR